MGWGGCVLYPEAVLVYESKAGAIAEPFVEKEREHFIGGTDGKGNNINKVDTPDYINAKKVA